MTNAIGVALPADGEMAECLLARAAEMAQRLNARWVAFVICNDLAPVRLQQAERAMQSGGTVFFCEGEDVAHTILSLAAREGVDVLLLGAPRRTGLLRRFRRGTVDRIVRAPRSFDVVVVGQQP